MSRNCRTELSQLMSHDARTDPSPLDLNPVLDVEALACRFEADGYTAIDGILTDESAARLHHCFQQWTAWNLVTRVEGTHRDLDAAGMAILPAEKREPFDQLVYREAREGFQYLYENFALYESGRKGKLTDPVMAAAFDLVRSEAFMALCRQVSGFHDITFTDCQVTRYRAGHFLTVHDDDIADKNRRAAYVLNLTPGWRADYGGVLQFLDEAGDVVRGLTPGFNRLALLKVPVRHAVSCVAPFAVGARFAITGWLRAGTEPGLD